MSGLAIGGYLAVTAYYLFGKVFFADLAFQLNLMLSAFLVAALDQFKIVADVRAGREGLLIGIMTSIQILFYGCAGGLIGLAVQLRR